MKQTLTIPQYRPPLTNQLMFGSVRRRCRLMKECRDLFAWYAREQAIVPASGPRRVDLVIVLSGRMRESDRDSLYKSVLDALVSCGLLIGDRVGDVALGSVTFERGAERETRVVLTDVGVMSERKVVNP